MRVPQFSPIASTVEQQTLTIDFGLRLPAGVQLTGTPTVTLTTLDGTDSTPQARLSAGPSIGTAPPPNGSGVFEAAILFQVANCVAGTLYGVSAYCLSTAGDIPEADTSFLCYTPD